MFPGTAFPARGTLTLVDPLEGVDQREFEFPFNPTELEESINVRWAEKQIVGQSHPTRQYVGTGPHTIPGVQFYVSAFAQASQQEQLNRNLTGPPSPPRDILLFKRFLQSLTVPRANARTVAGGAPPRVLFIWPKVISLVCTLNDLRIRYLQFATDGSPLIYIATVNFAEIRDVRMVSEDVFFQGSRRANL